MLRLPEPRFYAALTTGTISGVGRRRISNYAAHATCLAIGDPCMFRMKTRGSREILKPRACGEDRLPVLFTNAEEYLRPRASIYKVGR
jgi:hypothetical protein